jgi:hypothetical protein
MSIEIQTLELKKGKPLVPKIPEPLTFEKELIHGSISKISKKKNKKVEYINSKGVKVNENGERLTKRGKVDGRSNGTRVWKQIAEQNRNKNIVVSATVDDSESDDPDFEISLETAIEPQPAPEIISQTEKYIKEQADDRLKFDNEIFKLKKENSDLKTGLQFNDHLNRISHLAKSVKLKF